MGRTMCTQLAANHVIIVCHMCVDCGVLPGLGTLCSVLSRGHSCVLRVWRRALELWLVVVRAHIQITSMCAEADDY